MSPAGVAGIVTALLALCHPRVGEAQGGPPLSLEVRGGAAAPVGELAEPAPGLDAGAGPRLAAVLAWHFTPALALYGEYSRSWLQCDRCGARGIEDRVEDAGFGAGVEFRRDAGLRPWLRAGAILQALVFRDARTALASERAPGFRLAVGIAIPLGPAVALTPALGYGAYAAALPLGAEGAPAVEVQQFTADVGISYRF